MSDGIPECKGMHKSQTLFSLEREWLHQHSTGLPHGYPDRELLPCGSLCMVVRDGLYQKRFSTIIGNPGIGEISRNQCHH